MKSNPAKAGRLKTSGILFILSGVVSFLAAAMQKQSTFVGVGVAFIAIGLSFISQSKKSIAP